MTHFLVEVFQMWAVGTKKGEVRRGGRREEREGKNDMREERGSGGERKDSEALPGLRYFTYIILFDPQNKSLRWILQPCFIYKKTNSKESK